MLNSKRVSERLGVSKRHVQNMTKKALKGGKSSIACKGEKFTFKLVSTPETYGKAYLYTPIETPKAAPKPRRRVPSSVALNPADLPEIADFKRPTAKEKLAVITFCNTSRLPYGHIAKGLITKHQVYEVQESSFETKIRRWVKAYRTGGIRALEDKRGGRDSKVDESLIKEVLYSAGTKHYASLFLDYCYIYATENGQTLDIRNPSADIHYDTFVRAVKRLKRDDSLVRNYLRVGQDAMTYEQPSIGYDWEYANQQWEMDATKQDIMVKVPVVLTDHSKNEGYRDYFTHEASEHYQLVRMQIIGIVDNCSGSPIYGLFETSNYYSNARLLFKAIKKLGKPDLLRIDNGKDYISKNFLKMLMDQGIEYFICDKGRGDQKGKIERTFRTIQHSREFENLPGFVGHNVDQRQHLEGESSTKLEKLSGVATNIKGDAMWWWQLENWLDNFLEDKYFKRYADHQEHLLTAEGVEKTFMLLGKRYYRTVSKNGIFHNKEYYMSTEFWEQTTIGDRVEIIENIDDSNRLYVFKSAQYVCEVVEKGLYRKGLTLEQVKQIQKSYKQRVVKADKALMKKAQKEYSGLQNTVRDEYLDIETRNAEIKREQEKQKEDGGFDALAEVRRVALRAVN